MQVPQHPVALGIQRVGTGQRNDSHLHGGLYVSGRGAPHQDEPVIQVLLPAATEPSTQPPATRGGWEGSETRQAVTEHVHLSYNPPLSSAHQAPQSFQRCAWMEMVAGRGQLSSTPTEMSELHVYNATRSLRASQLQIYTPWLFDVHSSL